MHRSCLYFVSNTTPSGAIIECNSGGVVACSLALSISADDDWLAASVITLPARRNGKNVGIFLYSRYASRLLFLLLSSAASQAAEIVGAIIRRTFSPHSGGSGRCFLGKSCLSALPRKEDFLIRCESFEIND